MWEACIRLGIRPPEVESSWDDNNLEVQGDILAYHQIKQLEDLKEQQP